MDTYLTNVLKSLEVLEGDIEVIKVNVQRDHVHLVTIIPPRLSVASVIQFMKSQSAKKLRERFEFIGKAIGRGGMWSRGHGVSTVGMNEKAILRYVEHQEKEDKAQITLELGE